MMQPHSPTLSNPSMILPEYGIYDGPPSPPHEWFSSDIAEPWKKHLAGFSLDSTPPPGPIGLGPLTPTTPILYGNGTCLSDIGEVTEAESTYLPAKKLPGPAERRALKQRRQQQQQQVQVSPLRTGPTVQYIGNVRPMKRGSHERNTSVESTSTITSDGQAVEVLQDIDDDVSVDDSVFQGDDEQSVADSYTIGLIASETRRLVAEPMDQTECKSSAALSRRAEKILQTAKRRLNTMEGNLTRARSSLYTTSTRSMSSINSSSPLTRSPPSPLEYVGKRLANKPALSDPNLAGSGHVRVSSDQSISSPILSPLEAGPLPTRAASAAATYAAGKSGSRASTPARRHQSDGSSVSPIGRPSFAYGVVLEPPSGDEAPESSRDHESSQCDSEKSHPYIFLENRGLTRSASNMQMRDLRNQMHDLKGRLSVLRDRARDDTMKRWSLQSLRTPSPFTAADSWSQPNGQESIQVNQTSSLDLASNKKDRPLEDNSDTLPNHDAFSDATSIYEDVTELPYMQEVMIDDSTPHHNRGMEIDLSVEGSLGDEVLDGQNDAQAPDDESLDSKSNVSLDHDTVVSHEDREDAFDYEHFFLHSAMGTFDQKRLARRGSNHSFNSEESVETTRGPISNVEHTATISNPTRYIRHSRSESLNSVSTIATFATAKEYNLSEHQADLYEEYAVQQLLDTSQTLAGDTTLRRSSFGSLDVNCLPSDYGATVQQENRHVTAIQVSHFHIKQRASVGSINSTDSCGTQRSFPLVNKPVIELNSHSSTRTVTPEPSVNTNESADYDMEPTERRRASPVTMLARDERILVERVIVSVGKCVLGLEEARDSDHNKRLWTRRLDAARRILEGEEGAI